MKTYKNDQLEAAITEVSDIAQKVARNVNGIRVIVSPITEDVVKATNLSHILDVGNEYSFFYDNEADALADQSTLATHLRLRGVAVSKVHRHQPFSILG